MKFFGPTPSDILSKAINDRIDAALQVQSAQQTPRDYLGASRLGEECMRKLWFEFHAKGNAEPFPGRVLRRFRMGHMHEAETGAWLEGAGFRIEGEQDGFEDGQIGGHIDGRIISGPIELPYPLIWEHKIANSKSYAKFFKDGVAVSHPTYYAQCVIYSHKMGCNGTLFTMLNSDTSELRCELVENNAGKAAELIAKGKRIIAARTEEDVPRVALTETDYRCRMCSFAEHCWRKEANPAPAKMPSALPPWARK